MKRKKINSPLSGVMMQLLVIPIGFGIFGLEFIARLLSRLDLVAHRESDFRIMVGE